MGGKVSNKKPYSDDLERWDNDISFTFMHTYKSRYVKRTISLRSIIKFGINYKPVKAGRGRSKLTGATKYIRGYMFIITDSKHKYDLIDYIYFEKLTKILKKIAAYKMIFREKVEVTTKNGYVWQKFSRHYIPRFDRYKHYSALIKEYKEKYKPTPKNGN